MTFLAPAFLVGLAAVAIPILIHLIQRERKEVIHFPSLMFVRRIPYQSVERRRIHNLLLLLLRAAAMILLVAAFSRPFFMQDPVKAAESSAGAREVVILLDRSASMGYGDHWNRAKDEALKVVSGLGAQDKGTLVLFARHVEENVRATSDHGQFEVAIRSAKPSSDSTSYGPALRFAQSLLSRSALPRKEAFLISDFQKTGWTVREEIHLPEGAVLTPLSVATPDTSDVSVASVAFDRKTFTGEERATVTALITNRSGTAVSRMPVKLEVEGKQIDVRDLNIAPHSSESITFPAFTVSEANMRGTVSAAASDQMPADNVFHFVVSPSRPVSVLVIQADGAPPTDALYVTTAFGVSTTPPFKADVVPLSRVTPSTLEHRSVVMMNDVGSIPAPTDELLKRFVEQGGGLFIALGSRTPWASGNAPLLPGALGGPVDRVVGKSGTVGFLDYSHAVFELFKQPHSGNFTLAHFYRYRALNPSPTDRVLARFDDGAAAMVERRVGTGRVIAWTSSLDADWSDFPKIPVFPVFLFEVAKYLGHYEQPTTSYTVGRMLDVSAPLAAIVREGAAGDTAATTRKPSGVVVSPSGQQVTFGEGGTPTIELGEQGFYSVRMQGMGERRPFAVAVDLDPAESDLTPMEPREFVSTATGRAAVTPTGESLEHPNLTPEDIEKKRGIWWYLLAAGVAALVAELLLANRASKKFGVGLLQVKG